MSSGQYSLNLSSGLQYFFLSTIVHRDIPMIHSRLSKSRQSSMFGNTEPLNNSLGMDFLGNELFCLAQKFRSKNTNRRCPIANFIVLDLGNIDKHLKSVDSNDGVPLQRHYPTRWISRSWRRRW